MGLFSSRPEDPTEWAGLPAEPLRAQTSAEQLSERVDAEATQLLSDTGIGSVSIPISVPVATATGEADADDADDAD